ncbi:MAG: FtsQ-type POTRA domain-containing protein [Calditrichaeota bacterium]|nr:FtsQ-type POTRA domain-containing protein [Calditrichota bacterium]
MQRNGAEPRLKLLKIFTLTLILGIGGFGIWLTERGVSRWMLRADWNKLKRVEVIGAKRLPERDILRAANVPPGAQLSEIPLDTVAKRIERLAAVYKARVFRRTPGKLVIKVKEREPIASVVRRGVELVDENGVLFPIVGIGESVDLPVITVQTTGLSQEVVDAGFLRAVNLVSSLKRNYSTVYEHIGEVSCHGTRLEMRLREGGALVKAMNLEDGITLTKLEHFLIQRSADLGQKPSYIDLRYPSLVILKTDG